MTGPTKAELLAIENGQLYTLEDIAAIETGDLINEELLPCSKRVNDVTQELTMTECLIDDDLEFIDSYNDDIQGEHYNDADAWAFGNLV